jgi:hypothetical protein
MSAQHGFESALGIGNPAFLKIRRRFSNDGTRRLRESNTRPGKKKEDGTERRPPKGLTAT